MTGEALADNCLSDHICAAAAAGPPKLNKNVDPFFGQHNVMKSSGGGAGGGGGGSAAIPWHDCAPPPDIDLDDDIVEEIENEMGTGCHFAGFQTGLVT